MLHNDITHNKILVLSCMYRKYRTFITVCTLQNISQLKKTITPIYIIRQKIKENKLYSKTVLCHICLITFIIQCLY